MRVSVRVDAHRASDEFKQARKEINGRLKAAMKQAGERVVLPEAKRRSGGLKVAGISTASLLVVVPRRASAYITARGKRGRAVGLQEFGGTVRSPVLPKKKKAVLVNGQPIAAMTTPRVYTGRHFLTGAVQAKLPETERVILEEILDAFDGLEHHP